MTSVKGLPWEIKIPEEIDWLNVSPLKGTGYTKVNFNIVNGENTDTETTITIFFESSDSIIKKEMKVVRGSCCKCKDFDLYDGTCNCNNFDIYDDSCDSSSFDIYSESCDVNSFDIYDMTSCDANSFDLYEIP